MANSGSSPRANARGNDPIRRGVRAPETHAEMTMRIWHMTAAGMMAAAILACGGASAATDTAPNTPTSPTGTTPVTTTNVVLLNPDLTFAPSTISVPAGTTVTWEWNSCTGGAGGSGGYGTCISHSVVFDDGSNISSVVQDSGTFTRNFATVGTFKYHCGVHGASMSGEVVVH
jgi:plastocyanin